jgi:hypothetical protein
MGVAASSGGGWNEAEAAAGGPEMHAMEKVHYIFTHLFSYLLERQI